MINNDVDYKTLSKNQMMDLINKKSMYVKDVTEIEKSKRILKLGVTKFSKIELNVMINDLDFDIKNKL